MTNSARDQDVSRIFQEVFNTTKAAATPGDVPGSSNTQSIPRGSDAAQNMPQPKLRQPQNTKPKQP